MSSHREAPEIAKDPVADSTDVYAFISPDKPDTVTIIANYIPLQQPNGGPNFYEFADDVQYDIRVNNDATSGADLIYRFNFKTTIRNPDTFLYNTGTISAPSDTNWNRPQTFTCTRIDVKAKTSKVLVKNQVMPPCNVGVRSTPNYADLAAKAIYDDGTRKFFCGQRADAFRVDLGSVFDLAGLRPLNQAHAVPLTTMDGINSLKPYNVHSICMQVPIAELHAYGYAPSVPTSKRAAIGVWTTASRQRSRMFDRSTGTYSGTGPFDPVSRLGNPLVNEVLIPMAYKDKWNSADPHLDAQFDQYIAKPELAGLLPALYPGAFPNLDAFNQSGAKRADLQAILETGIPFGVLKDSEGESIPFQTFTGTFIQDMLRLNLAIPPTQEDDDSYSVLGVIGGDLAGFPNGRRPADDVTTIELRAIAGATIPLVDPSYTPDDVVSSVADGSYDNDDPTGDNSGLEPNHDNGNLNAPLLAAFPYLGHPNGGYQTDNAYSTSSSDGYGYDGTPLPRKKKK